MFKRCELVGHGHRAYWECLKCHHEFTQSVVDRMVLGKEKWVCPFGPDPYPARTRP